MSDAANPPITVEDVLALVAATLNRAGAVWPDAARIAPRRVGPSELPDARMKLDLASLEVLVDPVVCVAATEDTATRAAAAKLDWAAVEQLVDDELEARLYPTGRSRASCPSGTLRLVIATWSGDITTTQPWYACASIATFWPGIWPAAPRQR